MKLIDKAMESVMQDPEQLRKATVELYCPRDFGFEPQEESEKHCNCGDNACAICWNREYSDTVPAEKSHPEPQIKDSGERREFSSGAVRDIQEGKGRCDLLPLDVAAHLSDDDKVLMYMASFEKSRHPIDLWCAIGEFCKECGWDIMTMLLEVSIHMEEGAKKYGERNWEKGIPAHCYIDSAVRHYLKWRRGDTDERHDRAFCWNILCLIWTMRHRPECIDLPGGGEE